MKNIGLPAGSYAIFGSGPMGVRGIRDCGNMDVVVTDELFDEYRGMSGWDLKDSRDDEYLLNNGIFLWKGWGPGEWNVKQLIEDAEMIEGLPFVRLSDVLKWKKLSGREKDLKDIKLIESYLDKNDGKIAPVAKSPK